jgi:ribosome-associated protein
MSRKPKKGYYVQGQFVAEGSELDHELRNTDGPPSKTELKRESTELQALGEALLTLSAERLAALALPEKLFDALEQAKKISAFEGRRRQIQFIGKLMRQVDPVPIRAAIEAQHGGSAQDAMDLHLAEQWRDQLVLDDGALERWLAAHADSDVQQLRALIRQARKDARPERPGEALRHGKAYREIFQLVRGVLQHDSP